MVKVTFTSSALSNPGCPCLGRIKSLMQIRLPEWGLKKRQGLIFKPWLTETPLVIFYYGRNLSDTGFC